jgi:hypothetical protein
MSKPSTSFGEWTCTAVESFVLENISVQSLANETAGYHSMIVQTMMWLNETDMRALNRLQAMCEEKQGKVEWNR